MKKTFTLFAVYILIFVTLNSTNAQSADVTVGVSIISNYAYVSLFIKRTGTTPWKLGTSSFVFFVNNTALDNTNPIITNYGNFSGGYYQTLSTFTYGSNGRSLETNLNTFGFGTEILTTPQLVGTLRFEILNSGASHNIVWNQIFSAIILDDGFSEATINYIDPENTPLPIHLSSFSYSVVKNNIRLNWKTSKEINNKEFFIERKSANSEGWNVAGIIEGKGNTNTFTEYSFSDNNLQSGKYNYRLKQVDYNGNFEYHNLNGVVDIGVPDRFELSQNYPNPFNPNTKIELELPFDSKVHLVLFDITGREVKTLVNETRTAGYYIININGSDLPSGIYFYRIMAKSKDKDFLMTKKMMLIK